MIKHFVCSDTHFGHQNIIRYSNRPFSDWQEMGKAMMKTWNDRVTPDDIVYFLGDLAMGPGATEDYIIDVLRALNGFKLGILGNHDKRCKYSKGLKEILRRNSNKGDYFTILPNQIQDVTLEGHSFVMSHYPMFDWEDKHKGSIHLHGHSHTQFSPEAASNMIGSRRYDIGVDMYGGPVQITNDLQFLNNPKGWAV